MSDPSSGYDNRQLQSEALRRWKSLSDAEKPRRGPWPIDMLTDAELGVALANRLSLHEATGCRSVPGQADGAASESELARLSEENSRLKKDAAVWLAVAHCAACWQCSQNFGNNLCDTGIKLMEEARTGSTGRQVERLLSSESKP